MSQITEVVAEHYTKFVSTLILGICAWALTLLISVSQDMKLIEQRLQYIEDDHSKLELRVKYIEGNRFTREQSEIINYRLEQLEKQKDN